MSLWKRLFGGESPEQRIERARRSLADGELEHAIRTLIEVDGEAAEAIRAEARQLIAERDAPARPEPRGPRDVDEAEAMLRDHVSRASPTRRPGHRIDPPPTPQSIRVQLTSGDMGGLLASAAAKQPLGDATMMIVTDLDGTGEVTLTWDDLATLGLGRDEAFALGRRNALADVLGSIMMEQLAMPGATCDLAVCNGFYLGGAMIELREHLPAGTPQIVCPLSWHHWFVFELQPDATRETLAAMRALVDKISDGITTISNLTAWVTRSLWWWPVDEQPEVIDLAAPPPALVARLAD